jgi:arylsulfatase A-like enzyme
MLEAMSSRREFLLSAAAVAAPARPPNLIVVLADQQHWRAAGFMDRFFETPNLDRLAASGTVFENAFCATPQCSPSRSSLWTGWLPSRTGVYGNIGAAGGNALAQPTVAAALRKAGYATAYFGKWHLGQNAAALSGFDEASRDGKDEEATQRAVAYLEQKRFQARPFALFVSLVDPHDIYEFRAGGAQAPGRVALSRSWERESFAAKPAPQKQFMTEDQGKVIWEKPRAEWEAYRELYREKVRIYDARLGRILGALEASGEASRSVVAASSDHGDMDTNHKLIFKGPFLYEHMVRIPLVVRMPGGAPKRVRDFDTVNTDLAPTLLDLAGLPVPECQGVSLKPLLNGTGRAPRRDFVVGEYYGKQKWVNPGRMLRTRDFKYNLWIHHGEELYDLRNDPEELDNLAADTAHAARKREMRATLESWMKKHGDPFSTFRATTRAGAPLG